MKIKGITKHQLMAAVVTAGIEFYDDNLQFNREPEQLGNWLHFTIRVKDSHKAGAGRSASHFNRGRRQVSACWHAHRDVMRAIFRTAPDALLVTGIARYEGSDGFEHEFPATGHANVGPPIDPIARQDCCECPQVEF